MRRATHFVNSVAHLPAILPAGRSTEGDQVVWVNVLSMQEAHYLLKSLLRAAHVSFLEILTANRIKVELAQRLANLPWLQDTIDVIASRRGSLNLINRILGEQVIQIAEQADLVGLLHHLLIGSPIRCRALDRSSSSALLLGTFFGEGLRNQYLVDLIDLFQRRVVLRLLRLLRCLR